MAVPTQKYRVLKKSELTTKIEMLKSYPPYSALKISYLMKNVLEDKWPNYEFVVDSREEYEDVSLIGRPSKQNTLWLRNVVLHTRNKEHLKYLLLQPGVIDWGNPGLEVLVIRDLEPMMHDIIADQGYTFGDATMADMMVLEDWDFFRKRCQSLKLPDHMTFATITDEHHIEEVARAWPYGDPSCSQEYIDYMRTQCQNLPNICILKDGELVAWSSQQYHGAIGNTYVKPAYRRQGLGSLVTIEMAKKLLDSDIPIHIDFEVGHVGPFKMHSEIGFRMLPSLRHVYLTKHKCPGHSK